MLEEFDLTFPTEKGLRLAFGVSSLKLSHGIGGFDALMAGTALGYGLTLYTFNVKHFRAIRGLQLMVPYLK